jgi:hypothetical protein
VLFIIGPGNYALRRPAFLCQRWSYQHKFFTVYWSCATKSKCELSPALVMEWTAAQESLRDKGVVPDSHRKFSIIMRSLDGLSIRVKRIVRPSGLGIFQISNTPLRFELK